jgi:hypothetical protein
MKRIKVHKAYFITWLFILYIVYANSELLSTFFMATVIFSSAIVGFLAVGTLYQMVSGFDIMMLGGTFGALAYKRTGYEFYIRSISSILPANIAYMLETRKNQQKMLFTQEESRNIIEWLENKFIKQKAYINFFINTSMLIGLLGTFVGLVESIDKMGQIILSLNGDVDIKEIMQQFSGPLSGMAIGFGASLFGVVTAVILGLNGYILFRYQDTLISGIEEWLKDRIIDVSPEESSATGVIAVEDLAGHRKSFMDLFLEQMSEMNREIGKLTGMNETNHQMSLSLASIETAMREQQRYFQSMLEIQEKSLNQSQTFIASLVDLGESTNKKLDEGRVVLESFSEENRTILNLSNSRFSDLGQDIEKVNERLQRNENLLSSILTTNETQLHESQRMHGETQNSFARISVALEDENGHRTTIQTKFDHNNELLNQMIVNQQSMLQNNGEHFNTLMEGVSQANNLIGEGMLILEKYSAHQGNETQEMIKNQMKMLESLHKFNNLYEDGNHAHIHALKEILQSNLEGSGKLIQTMEEMQYSLDQNRIAIDKVGTIHESNAHESNALNLQSLSVLKGLESSVNQTQELSKGILDSSTTLQSSQAVHYEEVINIARELNSELLKIEKAIQSIEGAGNVGKKNGFFSYFFDK